MERWVPALSSPPTDTDECLGTPCQQRCKNSIGSYKCSCRTGFHLHGNRHSCIGELCGQWVVHLGSNQEGGQVSLEPGKINFWTFQSYGNSVQSTPIPCLVSALCETPQAGPSLAMSPSSCYVLFDALAYTSRTHLCSPVFLAAFAPWG